MSPHSAPNATGFVPVLRYRDVGAAAEWLCRAFGFERHHVVNGEGGSIIYAQLKCGSGLIMLVPLGESDLDRLMCQPAEAGGYETQVCYVVVPDAAQHCVTAAEAGARIVLALASDDRGGAGYSCRDLEGHVWSFGTYDPADAVKPFIPVALADEEPPPSRRGNEAGAPAHRTGSAFAAMAAAIMLAVVAGGAGLIAAFNGALTTITGQNSQASDERQAEATPDDRLAAALEAANRAAQDARAAAEKLQSETKARELAEAAAAAATAAAQAERDKTETLRLSLETDAQKTLDQLTQARTQRAATELDRSRLEHQLETEKREHAAHVAQMEALSERLAAAERVNASVAVQSQSQDGPSETSASAADASNPGQAGTASNSPSAATPATVEQAEPASGRDVMPNETGSIEDEKARAESGQETPPATAANPNSAEAVKAKPREIEPKSAQKSRPQRTVRSASAGAKKKASTDQPLVLEPATKQWPYNSW